MKEIIFKPKQVRIFLFLLLMLAILVILRWTRGMPLTGRLPWLGLAVAVTLVFFIMPRWFFPAFKIIMRASGFIGNAIFMVLSILVFLLILTPIAWVMKLLGKKVMHAVADPSRNSYYEPSEPRGDMERQF